MVIEMQNIVKTYRVGDNDVPVLHGIDLQVAQGEYVALMGSSGSGKSTLMNILGCLDRPSSGSYRLEDRNVADLSSDERAALRSEKIGFVFQSFNLLPRTSALENVIMPLMYSPAAISDEDAAKKAKILLERMGLGERMHHVPSQLSGGQQQRVAIARALINNPSILLADEPTGNLDSQTTEEVLAMFQELHRQGLTIVIVTHESDVGHHAERIVSLKDGRIEADSKPHRGAS